MDSTAIESRIHHHQPLSATSSAFQTSGANPSLLLTPVNNAPRSLYHGNQSLLLPNLAPFSPNYTQLLASAFPGPGFEGIDLDAMKVSNWIRRSQPYQRALDTTSLPPNPKNGQVPHIDPSSSFDNLPLKRARVSPAFGTHSPHSPKVTLGPEPFTPGFISSFGYMQNAAAPQSPLNLGGPLSTPAQTPNMGAHVANGMNVPQSPSMGMINGMMGMGGFSMVNFPFNMNMVRMQFHRMIPRADFYRLTQARRSCPGR